MNNNRAAVDSLLEKYQLYKKVAAEESLLSTQLAKAKLARKDTSSIAQEHQELKVELQRISDAMTFANPIIWMMYKYEAYQQEAQPIRTMHDFRVHCSKPGYICTKRYIFLNEQLERIDQRPLSDKNEYPDGLLLADVYSGLALGAVVGDDECMKQWQNAEYYQIDGKVAKWENGA